nr:probably inactive leucine-rich repeat receptor-like protein kinase At5g48380 isoform X2 [Ziziphus jujuba var. spinosa]
MQIISLSMVGNKKRNKANQWNLLKTLNGKEYTRLEKLVNKISFTELVNATDDFNVANVIGRGKMGTMYKATLPNGWFLAVKSIQNDSEQLESQFISELLALSRLRHENLIPLLGCCIEKNEKFLVYKYMSNGNLHDWLHPAEGDNRILDWPSRVKIAVGIAKGLAWLHHKCIFRVVHRNIATKSILLDRYFQPNISNFENSIISNHGGAMFLYPNDNDSGLLVNSGVWESDFVKKDVYNYGNVLFELITGRETVPSSFSTSIQKILQEWFDHLPSDSDSSILNDIIDKSLIGKGFSGEILQFLRIASDCVQPFPYQRPRMLEVYKRISSFGERYGIQSDPRILMQPNEKRLMTVNLR